MLATNLVEDTFRKVPVIVILEKGLIDRVSSCSRVDWSSGYAYLCKDDSKMLDSKADASFLGDGFQDSYSSVNTGRDVQVGADEVMHLKEFDALDVLVHGDEEHNIKLEIEFVFSNHLGVEDKLDFSFLVFSKVKDLRKQIIIKVCDEAKVLLDAGIEIVSWSIIPESVMCLQTKVKLPLNMTAKLV